MSGKSQVPGHLPVTIPEPAVGIVVTVHARQQCPHPQQNEFLHDVTGCGGDGGQGLDYGVRFGDVTGGAATQQDLDENGGRQPAPDAFAGGDEVVQGSPGQLDRFADVCPLRHAHRVVDVDDVRQV